MTTKMTIIYWKKCVLERSHTNVCFLGKQSAFLAESEPGDRYHSPLNLQILQRFQKSEQAICGLPDGPFVH